MEHFLEILQEEFKDALNKTEKANDRNYHFPEAEGLAKVAIGIRRSGKTYFLFQTMHELIAQGVPLERILYLNFEDDRLLPLNQKKMGDMVDGLYSLNPSLHNHHCYLFLDEVQNVEGWPVVIRRLLDTKNVDIYITGSSAKLLSKEIATSLRGRSIAIEIQPYNFAEYLSASDLPLPSKPFGKKALDQYRAHLMTYFQTGGFPGVQKLSFHERLETLQNYVDVVVLRDVIERHKVANIKLLKYFVSALLKNSSAPFSINKFYRDITSQGYKLGKDTLYTYLEYVEDAFLVFSLPTFSEALRDVETTPKKIYSIDCGLMNANTFNFHPNWGKLLENQIYLDLRREKKEVFYYKTSSGFEIDFVTRDLEGRLELIQAVWDQNEKETFKREERALKEAEKELGVPGRIIDCEAYLRNLVR